MRRILAVNFPPKDFSLLCGLVLKSGNKSFSLIDESKIDTGEKPPEAALLFWRKGAKAWLAQNAGAPCPSS